MAAIFAQLPLPLAVHLTLPVHNPDSLASSSSLGSTLRLPATKKPTAIHPNRISITLPRGERLPPYTLNPDPPVYTEHVQHREPKTLARYLFILGFVCPVLWVAGAFMMRYPAHNGPVYLPSVTGLPDKAVGGQYDFVQSRRIAEFKWAKRCMVAVFSFFCLGLVLGFSAWGAVNAGSESRKA
ncbi:hypothetical protein Hypma_005358 [Hypsizygus marmoreus]|uniref:Uncharacterized protein n=1 Tax=Hypsizygus marmoreus TaxID=39966 RepID=A0A369K4P0_HYPMA|nr:hypothetical protein Hypma_005358 [Hypsizygus marmoreus]